MLACPLRGFLLQGREGIDTQVHGDKNMQLPLLTWEQKLMPEPEMTIFFKFLLIVTYTC